MKYNIKFVFINQSFGESLISGINYLSIIQIWRLLKYLFCTKDK